MAKKQQQYRWRPAPWRVGEDAPPAGKEPAAAPEGEKKKIGTIALVVIGAGAVAFGVMELLGITKVFAPPPVVPAPGIPGAAPAPGAVPAPGSLLK
jgi:hypothetical protein